jgi:hypothetical protein
MTAEKSNPGFPMQLFFGSAEDGYSPFPHIIPFKQALPNLE